MGLLSAVATFKGDRSTVGAGFFAMAKQLGYEVGSNADARFEFWLRRLQRVYADYASG